MSTLTPKQQFEVAGAGVFVRDRNIESRLSDEEFHRAFSERITIWFTPGDYQAGKVGLAFDAAKKFHAVQLFRFPSVHVQELVLARIRSEFPNAKVEGLVD